MGATQRFPFNFQFDREKEWTVVGDRNMELFIVIDC
jgi:hypothetical protein